MATWKSNALVLVSTAGLLATLCVWAFGSRVDDQSQQLSLGSSLHVTVRAPQRPHGFVNRQLVFFNDLDFSPHRGVNAYHTWEVWRPLPGIFIERSAPGVSALVYGLGPAQTGLRWFSVHVSLAYPVTLFGIAPSAWLLQQSRRAGRGFPVVPQEPNEVRALLDESERSKP